MVFNINPAVLWMFGGVATAGGVGYVVVEQNRLQPPEQIASLVQPQADSAKPEIIVPETKKVEKTPIAEPEKQQEIVPPSFDVLRVEKDGSAVIAGSALPDSQVEILDGGKVIATTRAGPAGDFAIVLDEPLSAGPHELSIRSTPKQGDPVVSLEAGIINVPEGGDDLIAMVTKPGAPSRILQQPVEPEVKEIAEPPKEQVTEPVPEPGEPETQVSAIEPKPETAEVEIDEPVVEKVETPETPEIEAPATSNVPVLIEAAEVEGDKMFIAGTGKPGASVHIYMDGKHIGSASVGEEGAFLFEGEGGLKAGRYALRADMIEGESAKVTARAEVSLLHQPEVSETVAVAKAEETPAPAITQNPTPEPVVEALTEKTEPVEKVEVAEAKPEITPTVPVAKVQPEVTKTAEPATPEIAKPAAKPALVAVTEPSEPTEPVIKEIVTGSSVIIRRGDNLWRVSRRKWGQGIRYTVIFEANKTQIRDPHLIFPGQVFKIPKVASEETDENSG